MKFDPKVEKKNPLAYYIVSFFLGMVISFIGWQMNESTSMGTARFGVPVIILGAIMIVVGAIGMFTYKKKAKRL
jgi:phosphoglycerol transferase MdoB-like AlkP superfamily enzyme